MKRSRGWLAWSGAALALVAIPAGAVDFKEVTVVADVAGAAEDAAPEVTLRLSPRGNLETGGPLPEEIVAELRARREYPFRLRRDLLWIARAEAPGFWSPEEAVVVDAVEGPVRLRLFPVGEIHVPVKPARFGEVPDRIEARFQPQPGTKTSGTGPRGALTCPVVDRVARCLLPAGTLDLRLSAPPWAPVYRSGTEIVAGSVRTLEPVTLVRGASISGYVLTEEGDAAPAGTTVRLALPGEDGSRPDPKLELVSTSAEIDARGFFQFVGVLPGYYGLVAEADGYAPARMRSVEVRPDLESSLIDPLVLARPVELEVELSPPRDPWGRVWRVRLSEVEPETERWRSSIDGEVSPDGRWSLPGLSPGSYYLTVLGPDETQWVQERIEIVGGEDPLFVPVPVVEVEGTVVRGDEPAPGRLWFGTRHGGRRVVVEVDEEGSFAGFLPSSGTWPLEWVPSDGNELTVILEAVEIPDRSRVSLSIEIPDTRQAGEVVDEGGASVAGARVRLASEERDGGSSMVTTDDEGRFFVAGLQPGGYTIQARKGDAVSDMVRIELNEELESPELRLVIHETFRYTGRVHAGGRAVAGARITAWPDLGSAPGVSFLEAVSGPEGLFHVEAPAGLSALNLVVVARGFGSRLSRQLLSREGWVDVELDPYPGTLWVAASKTPGSGARADPPAPTPLLAHEGAFLPVSALLRILGVRGTFEPGVVMIPALEPGGYALCVGRGALEALRRSEEPSGPACATGVLPPLGELRLEAPAPAVDSRAPR